MASQSAMVLKRKIVFVSCHDSRTKRDVIRMHMATPTLPQLHAYVDNTTNDVPTYLLNQVPTFMRARQRACTPAYPTTCLRTYNATVPAHLLPTYLPTSCLLTCPSSWRREPTLPTNVHARESACIHACLHHYVRTYLARHLPHHPLRTYLPDFLTTYVPTFYLTNLTNHLRSCTPAGLPTILRNQTPTLLRAYPTTNLPDILTT
jgi:hypothetical protein